MDQTITRSAIARAVIIAATIALAVATGSAVSAQSLTQPSVAARAPLRPALAKSTHAGRMTSCAMYGAGFINVPGSDVCLKIGGYVQTEIGR
jgi:hypothetical protein